MADGIWDWLTVSSTVFFLNDDTMADHKVLLPPQICAEGCAMAYAQQLSSICFSVNVKVSCIKFDLTQCVFLASAHRITHLSGSFHCGQTNE